MSRKACPELMLAGLALRTLLSVCQNQGHPPNGCFRLKSSAKQVPSFDTSPTSSAAQSAQPFPGDTTCYWLSAHQSPPCGTLPGPKIACPALRGHISMSHGLIGIACSSPLRGWGSSWEIARNRASRPVGRHYASQSTTFPVVDTCP